MDNIQAQFQTNEALISFIEGYKSNANLCFYSTNKKVKLYPVAYDMKELEEDIRVARRPGP